MAIGRVILIDGNRPSGRKDEVCIGGAIVATSQFTLDPEDPARNIFDEDPTSFLRVHEGFNVGSLPVTFRIEVPDHDPARPIVFNFAYRRLGDMEAEGIFGPFISDGPSWTRPDSIVDHGAYLTASATLTSSTVMSNSTGFGLGIDLPYDSEGVSIPYIEIYSIIVDYASPVKGAWPLRQRQALTGAPSWPLRQRQNGGHSGSWPLRQRQRGV